MAFGQKTPRSSPLRPSAEALTAIADVLKQSQRRVSTALRSIPAHLQVLRQPVVGFGLIVIALIWVCAYVLIGQEQASIQRETERDVESLSTIFERNVFHTVSDLDRILKFLIWAHEKSGKNADWRRLVKQDYSVDDEAVQIAVTDATGMMITSSVDLNPQTPIDLSDRPHFLAQLHSTRDELFIGPVVIGRASGKLSVQFSRKTVDENGKFAGIVVISLDPRHFVQPYMKTDLGEGGGVALVGDDGILRAGTGVFASHIGQRGDDPSLPIDHVVSEKATTMSNGIVLSSREVQDYPLRVVVASPNAGSLPDWRWHRTGYWAAAVALSLATLVIMIGVAARRNRYEQRILNLSRHDSLTGLPNRNELLQRLEWLYRQPPEQRQFALHLIDLDRFKFVNDTFGHDAGDELLREVAARLRPLSGSEIVARLGGDEFAILQRVEDYRADARIFALDIIARLSEPLTRGRLRIAVGATIGVASARSDGAAAGDLMKSADLALYAAKNQGRGGYRHYDQSMLRAIQDRQRIENILRTALRNGGFELAYQGVNCVKTEQILGFEALLRLAGPENASLGPAVFIPVAEDCGLITEIGAWVLQRACRDAARWPAPTRVAVNCSPVQFECCDLVELVGKALAETGLEPYRLEIEITESMLLRERAVEQLKALRAMGVGVSIDDFGTGYSCLSYLEKCPVSSIKIDRSFVRKIDERREAVATLRAIIDLAASFGLTTVAEGVETRAQFTVLRDLGCNSVQGYFFSAPSTLAEAERAIGLGAYRPLAGAA